ncbi:hypothetical protein [Massilia sp. TSP1-1-2]|uniref:hypothetical protein n=1 Tax=unclassified Massilia TaxID=2609279 RepID=UPI003CEB04B1
MSTTYLLELSAAQFLPLLHLCATYLVIGALLLTFRPLLVGIARALWLLAFPRLSLDQRARRAQMRDQRLIQKMIAASTSPSMTAELQAMAARG